MTKETLFSLTSDFLNHSCVSQFQEVTQLHLHSRKKKSIWVSNIKEARYFHVIKATSQVFVLEMYIIAGNFLSTTLFDGWHVIITVNNLNRYKKGRIKIFTLKYLKSHYEYGKICLHKHVYLLRKNQGVVASPWSVNNIWIFAKN